MHKVVDVVDFSFQYWFLGYDDTLVLANRLVALELGLQSIRPEQSLILNQFRTYLSDFLVRATDEWPVSFGLTMRGLHVLVRDKVVAILLLHGIGLSLSET